MNGDFSVKWNTLQNQIRGPWSNYFSLQGLLRAKIEVSKYKIYFFIWAIKSLSLSLHSLHSASFITAVPQKVAKHENSTYLGALILLNIFKQLKFIAHPDGTLECPHELYLKMFEASAEMKILGFSSISSCMTVTRMCIL